MGKTKRVLVALSGGVDSAVAGWLLKETGHEVVGVFMSRGARPVSREGTSLEENARKVAAFLDVPLHAVDLSEAFEVLIDYFCSEYLRGRTPNPCVLCNQQIKFARLLVEADKLGLDALATGHYVRSGRRDTRWCLRRGVDADKDQSYYLCALSQGNVARALFPLGERTKTDVRKLAGEIGLPAAHTSESQDVCFVRRGEYAKFISGRVGAEVKPGEIVDTSGNVVGRHEGIIDFTVGQRRGVGVAMGEPMYVVDVDPRSNRVVIGRADDLLVGEFVAENVNWVSIAGPKRPLRCTVQVRYRSKPVPATVTVAGRFRVHVKFDEPQRAVTPGQAAVLYDDDLLLGGGWITRERGFA